MTCNTSVSSARLSGPANGLSGQGRRARIQLNTGTSPSPNATLPKPIIWALHSTCARLRAWVSACKVFKVPADRQRLQRHTSRTCLQQPQRRPPVRSLYPLQQAMATVQLWPAQARLLAASQRPPALGPPGTAALLAPAWRTSWIINRGCRSTARRRFATQGAAVHLQDALGNALRPKDKVSSPVKACQLGQQQRGPGAHRGTGIPGIWELLGVEAPR